MMKYDSNRKCKNCDGIGIVGTKELSSKCLYCRGKGYRISSYGIDKKQPGDI